MPTANNPKKRPASVNLGYRLNHLLNRSTRLGQTEEGLILPTAQSTGSGIVVIVGEPGLGKSTLALQIAVAAARAQCDSAYISMEEDPQRIKEKAAIFGWDDFFYEAVCLHLPTNDSPIDSGLGSPGAASLASILRDGANRQKANSQSGTILLPGLLPRPLARNEERLFEFFWEQYRQVEFLVRSAAQYNNDVLTNEGQETGQGLGLRLVVIDSLNMLGLDPGNREMYYRLFDLFRRSQILGVFTVEPGSDVAFDSTMGDVVLHFSKERDGGYEVTFIECTKSRFRKPTLGRHAYKIVSPSTQDGTDEGDVGVVLLPSLHAIVAATQDQSIQSQTCASGKNDLQTNRNTSSGTAHEGFPFGWGDTITRHLLRSNLSRGDVVALTGPSGTFKTQIALNFLLHGVNACETVLYLRLQSPTKLSLRPGNEKIMPYADPKLTPNPGETNDSKEAKAKEEAKAKKEEEARDNVRRLAAQMLEDPEESKRLVRLGWESKFTAQAIRGKPLPGNESGPTLIVVDFPMGMLQPEEFMDAVWWILEKYKDSNSRIPVQRIVLDDVGSIGASYPLLKHSINSGDHFLSYFLHVMRNRGLDVLLVGTVGDFREANEVVGQACSLADAVLRTSIGTVYGDKYVLISGDGMAARQPNMGDASPIVLMPGGEEDRYRLLKPDARLLDEYVGFGTDQIYRPGIVLHFFQENDIQKRYNRGVLERLQDRYGKPIGCSEGRTSGVDLKPFSPHSPVRLGTAMDESVPECPRDHTSVRMVDEFEAQPVGEAQPASEADLTGASSKHTKRGSDKMFVRNVMFLACKQEAKKIAECRCWSEMLNALEKEAKAQGSLFVAFDQVAQESLACLVLGAIHVGVGAKWYASSRNKIDVAEWINSSKDQGSRRVARELHAIHRIMTHFGAKRTQGRDPQIAVRPKEADQEEPRHLPPNADIYVCWYSQLRELISRCPDLCRQLTVRSLPGEGFKGDWYLRVEEGSVSMRCGNTIVESLSTPSENFERFREGVGLPVEGVFQDETKLLAWPGAPSDFLLHEVTKIWNEAHRRSDIKDYQKISRVLYGIGETVAGRRQTIREVMECEEANEVYDEDYFGNIVARLPDLFRSLCR